MFFISSHDSLFRYHLYSNPHQSFQGVGHEISFWCETIGSRFRVQGMRSVSDVERLIVFQGIGYGISFWCETIDCVSGHRICDQLLMWDDWIAIPGHRVWDQFPIWNSLIMFQGTGYEISFWCEMIGLWFRVKGIWSSGFRVPFSEVRILYIKGSGFPLFRFSPSPLTSHSTLSFLTHRLLTWPPILKIFFILLVRLVVPLSGTWSLSNASRLVLLLRTPYVFSSFILLMISNILFILRV
jgi:hypothetical protein